MVSLSNPLMVSLSNHEIPALIVPPLIAIIRAMNSLAVVMAAALAQAAPSQKIEIVSVTGCLKEAPANSWTLTGATDPVASNANAPPAKEVPAAPPAGKIGRASCRERVCQYV